MTDDLDALYIEKLKKLEEKIAEYEGYKGALEISYGLRRDPLPYVTIGYVPGGTAKIVKVHNVDLLPGDAVSVGGLILAV